MAHGNFDPSMALEPPGGGQEVCGPIKWAGTLSWDLTAFTVEILFVIVVQFTCGKVVTAVTQAPTTVTSAQSSPPPTEWETDVFATGSDALAAGPAYAVAMVQVGLQGRRKSVIEFWNENISFSL